MSNMFVWFDSNVPEHTRKALEDYFIHGYQPGSFLTSVLANDLLTASCRADAQNKQCLGYIAEWIVHNSPVGSYGSYDAVYSWCRGNEHRTHFEKQCIVKILSTEY
jgi:hypothetical protein